MDYGLSLTWALALWMAAALAVVVAQWKRELPSAGLTIAYVAFLWRLHWTGGAIYLPGSPLPYSEAAIAGFMQSLYAVGAFAVGSVLVAPLLVSKRARAIKRIVVGSTYYRWSRNNVPWIFIAVGLLCYVLAATPVRQLPSATSILTAGQDFLLAGICLHTLFLIVEDRKIRLVGVIVLLAVFPLITLAAAGFLGQGAMMAALVLLFVARFYEPRWHLVVGGLVVAFLAMSLYVTYKRDKQELRAVIWGGATVQERVAAVTSTLGDFEWFDPNDVGHLQAIEGRVSQNELVGDAILYTSSSNQYAEGRTLKAALAAAVPRVVWPDKPSVAGGHEVASRYTGRTFATGTSVGMGHVMELYVNFGRAGVIVGFVILGILVTYIDHRAGLYLSAGEWGNFAMLFVAGIGLLSVATTFSILVPRVLAGLLVGWGVKTFVLPQFRRGGVGTPRPSSVP